MNIREAIQDIVNDKLKGGRIRIASVVSIQGDTITVNMLDTETEIDGVKLQAKSASGILLTPAVGSIVILGRISDFEFFVLMYSGLSEVKFLDGSFGGVVKVTELVQKLNNLENKVNALITWGLTVSPAFSPGTLLTPTVNEDIENIKVKHGTV